MTTFTATDEFLLRQYLDPEPSQEQNPEPRFLVTYSDGSEDWFGSCGDALAAVRDAYQYQLSATWDYVF